MGSTSKEPVSSVKVNDQVIIDLKRDASFNSSNHSLNPCFSQSTIVKFSTSHKSNIFELIRLILYYESFLSLAALKTITPDRILLYDKNDFECVGDKKSFRISELFFVQKTEPITRKRSTDFLFSYTQINDIYPDILTKWYRSDKKIIPIRQHLLNSVKTREIFESIDFLIVIQAVEGFCLRFRKKKKNITEQLNNLLEEFSDVSVISNLDLNINHVVNSRHYYSHFYNMKSDRPALDGIELYYLTRKLRIVLICCLLSYCGIENSRINIILNSTNNPLIKFD